MENEKNKIAKVEPELEFLETYEREFVLLYVQLNDLSVVKNHLEISVEDAINMYKDPKIQSAIKYCKNLRLANIYKRKMLSLEELGSILTNQITDFDLPLDSHLTPKEKLEASKLLIEVHRTISSSIQDPSTIEAYDLKFDPKDLDIDQIKDLLVKIKVEPSKEQDREDSTPIELMYLESSEVINHRKEKFDKVKTEIQNRVNKIKREKGETYEENK